MKRKLSTIILGALLLIMLVQGLPESGLEQPSRSLYLMNTAGGFISR